MLILLIINLLILALVIWNAVAWPAPAAGENASRDNCSILIPARNEENNIGACLDSAMEQGNVVCEIIVCNDHSEDGTAAVVHKYGEAEPKIRLIEADELPEGWCGKNFACVSLAAEARGDWLLFLDADARLEIDAVSRMMTEASRHGTSFLSCWPGLIMAGPWEKALMPMLNFVVFTLFPAPLSIRRSDPSLGLAHGACILVRQADYKETGGHRLVFDKIFEDTSLARVWRSIGRQGICLDGQNLVRVRMYDSLGGIWQGFQKNFFPAFSKPINFWLFLAFHVIFFLMPFAALPGFAMGDLSLWPLAGAAVCVLLMRGVQARRFHYPAWSVFAHPVGELVLIGIGLSSWLSCRAGRGVEWKGRVYGRKPVGGKSLPNAAPPVQGSYRE